MGDGNVNTYNALPSDFKENISLMKSGHHGAANTINKEMVENTKIFVISTGQNIYGHPNPDTISILEGNKKEFYRTDFHNAIKLIFDKNLTIKTFSPKAKRFIYSL